MSINNVPSFQLTKEAISYAKKKYLKRYPHSSDFEYILTIYSDKIKPFKINENWYDSNILNNLHISDETVEKIHFVMRSIAEYYMIQVFHALKIDLNDPNVMDEKGGTPYRIIKMWSGKDIEDDRELLCGRYTKPVKIATFPNEISDGDYPNPIIKEIDLTAVCSHHFAPFSTKFSDKSKIVIAYIPDKYVLGISKLQRVVRRIAQRGWLQEDLTRAIYTEISKVAKTKSVYVKLKNLKHSCEFLRGALTDSDGFTTEYYGGLFSKDKELLEFVRYY